jgi:prevent-host-death family protein
MRYLCIIGAQGEPSGTLPLMEQMGIRELRANLGGVVRRVQAGESIEVTDHGHPVARLVPLRHRSRLEQLVAEGKATMPEGSMADLLSRVPLPPEPGKPTLSEILAELRADER